MKKKQLQSLIFYIGIPALVIILMVSMLNSFRSASAETKVYSDIIKYFETEQVKEYKMNLGSGDNGEWTFLDLIGLMSFFIGVQNLDLNVTQEDAQNLERELTKKTDRIINEIHTHLEMQDEKLNEILQRLEDIENGHKRNL